MAYHPGYSPGDGNDGGRYQGRNHAAQAHLYQQPRQYSLPSQQAQNMGDFPPQQRQQLGYQGQAPPTFNPQSAYQMPQYFDQTPQAPFYQQPYHRPNIPAQDISQYPPRPQYYKQSPPLPRSQAPAQPGAFPSTSQSSHQQFHAQTSYAPPVHANYSDRTIVFPGSQRAPQSSGQSSAASSSQSGHPQAQRSRSEVHSKAQTARPLPQSAPQAPPAIKHRDSQATTSQRAPPVPAMQSGRPHHGQILQENLPPSSSAGKPQPDQRRIAQVHIPVQRTPSKSQDSAMARPPKRRKSNEGHVVPASHLAAASQPASASRGGHHAVATASSSTKPTTAQASAAPTAPAIDYQAALLGLSDEYINAAYSLSAALASDDSENEDLLDEYYALLSTGMGCLDSVLQNYRITDPRQEVRVRLRYASLLCEETDNGVQAEEVLSKGITVCERARLTDSKYAMHHLLVRVWFKDGKLKAATKSLDRLIVEVEKLSLVHWAYAFRFLRVSLSLKTLTTSSETAMLVKQLTSITEIAHRNRHIAVQMVALTVEALVHIRSGSPESTDLAQRALAGVRMHQLSTDLDSLPQVRVLIGYIDLSCSLLQLNHEEAKAKAAIVHQNMELSKQKGYWRSDGSWLVPVSADSTFVADIQADTAGVMELTASKQCALRFEWLNPAQVCSLGYLLSGLMAIHQSANKERKAQVFLAEGMKLTDIVPNKLPQSLVAARAERSSSMLARVILRAYGVFAYCSTFDWDKASRGAAKCREMLAVLPQPLDADLLALVAYLEALSKHGLGDLPAALELYSSRDLEIGWSVDIKTTAAHVNPIRVLAALHRISITRHLTPADSSAVKIKREDDQVESEEVLLNRLEALCLTSINANGNEFGIKAIEAAYYILKATRSGAYGEGLLIKTKSHLQSGVKAAQRPQNNHLLTVVMNLMTQLFFTNIVGDQAEKSAAAGRSLAVKSQDKLWMAVASGMYATTLEKCGKLAEAQIMQREAHAALEELPVSLKGALSRDQEG